MRRSRNEAENENSAETERENPMMALAVRRKWPSVGISREAISSPRSTETIDLERDMD